MTLSGFAVPEADSDGSGGYSTGIRLHSLPATAPLAGAGEAGRLPCHSAWRHPLFSV